MSRLQGQNDPCPLVPHGTACAAPLPSDGKVTTTCLLVPIAVPVATTASYCIAEKSFKKIW